MIAMAELRMAEKESFMAKYSVKFRIKPRAIELANPAPSMLLKKWLVKYRVKFSEGIAIRAVTNTLIIAKRNPLIVRSDSSIP